MGNTIMELLQQILYDMLYSIGLNIGLCSAYVLLVWSLKFYQVTNKKQSS